MVSIQASPSVFENLQRFATFANFPSWSPVYSSKLSAAGFSYGGNSDMVKCKSCNLELGDWSKQTLSPMILHLKNAPSCPLAKKLKEFVSKSELEPKMELQLAFQGPEEKLALELPEKSSQSTSKPPPEANILDSTKLEDTNTTQSASNSMDKMDGGNIHSSNAIIPNVPPKYQNYTLLFQREETFDGWPRDHPISPTDLSRAGFFFTGTNDLVRCFNCGGGLTSWDTDDNPWVEHARWFSKCTFLRQNKGDEFIELVQKTVKELEDKEKNTPSGSGASNASVNRAKDDIEQLVCVISVRELGYCMEIIRRAYCQATEKLNTNDISAVQLMEQVLENEENMSSGAAGSDPSPQYESENLSITTEESKIESNSPFHTTQPKGHSNHQHCEPSLNTASAQKGATSSPAFNSDTLLCKVCLEEPVAVTFLPCGHLCTCGQCAPAMKRCPICRTWVKGSVKTYLP